MKVLIILLYLGSSLGSSFAGLNLPQSHRPIEWQIMDLQEKLDIKVKSSLNPIVSQEDYVVQVRVEIDEAKKMNLTPKSAGGGGGGGEGGEDNKQKEEKKKKQGVRLSKASEEEASEDYIVFSKLGIEAPIYGLEEESGSLPLINLGGLDTAKPDAKGGDKPKSEVDMIQKTLVELNDKYNLFKYLLGVEITIFLDDQIVNESRKAIEKIIDGISFNLGEIEPNVRIEYVPLVAQKKAPKASTKKVGDKKKEYINWLSKFSTTIGLIFAAIILGIFALILLKKYDGMKKESTVNTKGKQESNQNDSSKEDQDSEDSGGPMAAGGPLGDEGGTGLDGIERFRKYLEISKNDAILLVKRWIKESSKQSNLALKSLVKSLENDELLVIFDSLKLQDRSKWKEVAAEGITSEELLKSTSYISRQIVEGIMVPNVITDEQVVDLILDLSPKDASKFCQDNLEHGAILLNILNSSIINEIFEFLDADTVGLLISKSSEFHQDNVSNQLNSLRSALQGYRKDAYRAPFMDRILDLIRLSKGESDTALYTALAKVESYEYVSDMARSYFPSPLVAFVSDNAFKLVTEDMELKQIAEFFVSLGDSQRLNFMSKFAEEGTKAREMLELEIEQIMDDELLAHRLRKDHVEIWGNFLESMRVKVRSDQDVYKEVKDDIEQWVREIYSNLGLESDQFDTGIAI